jgi:hypothetical protein
LPTSDPDGIRYKGTSLGWSDNPGDREEGFRLIGRVRNGASKGEGTSRVAGNGCCPRDLSERLGLDRRIGDGSRNSLADEPEQKLVTFTATDQDQTRISELLQ